LTTQFDLAQSLDEVWLQHLLFDTPAVVEFVACQSLLEEHLLLSITGDERAMPEASVPIPAGFDALSKAEQVRYLQALWDQISEDPGALPVPESHLRLAEERLQRYREDPSRGHSALEVLDRLADPSKANTKSK